MNIWASVSVGWSFSTAARSSEYGGGVKAMIQRCSTPARPAHNHRRHERGAAIYVAAGATSKAASSAASQAIKAARRSTRWKIHRLHQKAKK